MLVRTFSPYTRYVDRQTNTKIVPNSTRRLTDSHFKTHQPDSTSIHDNIVSTKSGGGGSGSDNRSLRGAWLGGSGRTLEIIAQRGHSASNGLVSFERDYRTTEFSILFDIVTYLLRHLAGLKSAVYITNRNKCAIRDAILVPAWENTSSIGIEDRWNDRFVGTLIQRDREIVQRIWKVAQRYDNVIRVTLDATAE